MLLQTNSYIVPRDKRMEHARLLRKFRQTLIRLGCDHFEVFEQAGPNWNSQDTTGRFVQIMRFRDRKHQLEVQAAERTDPAAQSLIREFCDLINFPYQQQEGLFAVGYYVGFMRMPPAQSFGPAVEETPAVESQQEVSPQDEALAQEEIPPQEETALQEETQPEYQTTDQHQTPAEAEGAETEGAETEAAAVAGEQTESEEDLSHEEQAALGSGPATEAEISAEHHDEPINLGDQSTEPAAEATDHAEITEQTPEDAAVEALFGGEEAPTGEAPLLDESGESQFAIGGNGEHEEHSESDNGHPVVPSNGDSHEHAEGNGESAEAEVSEDAPADELSTSGMDSVFGEHVPADRIPPAHDDDVFAGPDSESHS